MTWWQWVLVAVLGLAALPVAGWLLGAVLYLAVVVLAAAVMVAAVPVLLLLGAIAAGWDALRR